MTPAFLAVHSGPAAGQRIPVDRRLVVGRQGAEVTIADAELSRRHATVEPSPDGLVVTDLGSTNGTWVNGTKIAGPTSVRPGDEVRMGDSVMGAEGPRDADATALPRQAGPSPPTQLASPPTQLGSPPTQLASPPTQLASPPAPTTADAASSQQPFGAFAPSPISTHARRPAATRLKGGLIGTWVVVALDGLALVVYFAVR